MSHTTFYRKYRSQTFSELEGQAHIIQTLSNALTQNRVSHAYIFSGPRGTGKTSTARILAKALNCRNGRSISPCMTCDLCQKITAGQAVDVVEIDAASHTGVDHMRALNEQVYFAPVEAQFKVYIIDEAHMLSAGAFNALLKTLEEPPACTVFILATTESHKIPMTIHSRCQNLHFRKLAVSELLSQLQKIVALESIQIEEGGLNRIARQAGGCMRDAVSLLDQLYSFCGHSISEEQVVLMLGGAHVDQAFSVLSDFFAGRKQAVISGLKSLFLEGVNVSQWVSDVAQWVKAIMYIHLQLEAELDLDAARITRLREVGQGVSFLRLSQLLEGLARLEMELRLFPNPELLLEIRFLNWMMVDSGEFSNEGSSPLPTAKATRVSPVVAAPPVPLTSPVGTPPVSSPGVKPILVETPAPSRSEPGSLSEQWAEILKQVKTQRPTLFSVLNHSQAVKVTDAQVLIRLKQDFKFFRDKLQEEAHSHFLMQVMTSVIGRSMTLGFVDHTSESNGNPEPVHGLTPVVEREAVNLSTPQKINQIVALFEGKIL